MFPQLPDEDAVLLIDEDRLCETLVRRLVELATHFISQAPPDLLLQCGDQFVDIAQLVVRLAGTKPAARAVSAKPTYMSAPLARRVRTFIETHADTIANRRSIAMRLRCGASHMDAVFKREFGLTPMAYLTEVRAIRAHELITNTSAGLADIAGACGFRSYATFYRVFLAKYGMPPSAFRDAARGRPAASGALPGVRDSNCANPTATDEK